MLRLAALGCEVFLGHELGQLDCGRIEPVDRHEVSCKTKKEEEEEEEERRRREKRRQDSAPRLFLVLHSSIKLDVILGSIRVKLQVAAVHAQHRVRDPRVRFDKLSPRRRKKRKKKLCVREEEREREKVGPRGNGARCGGAA
jgi:hypothetical protein